MPRKVSSNSSNLGRVPHGLPTPRNMPMALPPSHMTDGRNFKTIVSNSELRPQLCDVFQELLIYLFYGGIFYRRSNRPTKHATELPVAFLFDPNILNAVDRYYPSDTGALQKMQRES
jgi:hypothetical protein